LVDLEGQHHPLDKEMQGELVDPYLDLVAAVEEAPAVRV
jgi:hypothetical protein